VGFECLCPAKTYLKNGFRVNDQKLNLKNNPKIQRMLIAWFIWFIIFRAWFISRKPYKKWTFLNLRAKQHDGLLDSEI
jgi:hypothetical protein